ncbi:MAG: DNA mismatch repair protein MutS [Bacteroidetes bacterium]|nr:DNA mismatch repair protein MutS [Bacteroidota bacterium]
MEIDKTTLNDLSIFNSEEEFSVFSKLNYTVTSNGKDQLIRNLSRPLPSIEAIKGIQQTLQQILLQEKDWPGQISNGTIKVVETFYESTIDPLPETVTQLTTYSYKLLHGPDYSLVKYSAIHCFDFIKGMQLLVKHFLHNETATPLKILLEEAKQIINKEQFSVVEKHNASAELTVADNLQFARFLRFSFKVNMLRLLQIHAQLDAWYAMALAVRKHRLVFPRIQESAQPFIEIKGLYHILLQQPVAYDVQLNRDTNFLFLTGANMAGKSTFIKSVGTAVFLAHIGMGVPAKEMQLSLFDGVLSNINVMDNIAKGESYFYNEIQRIKATIQKVNDGRKWLILIDELFKGTNIQDAMKCSTAVIEGLLKIKNSIFILSTHLYEIGEGLKVHSNIHFNYFETSVVNDQLQFNYQLKDGISNDRFGYLILKKEGVVKMLEEL